MAKFILDIVTKTLQAAKPATQDRANVSRNLTAMRMTPAVLFHPWRLRSPGSHSESEPSFSPVESAVALLDGLKPVSPVDAGRSGSSAGITAAPSMRHHQDARHDCQSNVCVDVRNDGLTGYRPGRGLGSAYTSGK